MRIIDIYQTDTTFFIHFYCIKIFYNCVINLIKKGISLIYIKAHNIVLCKIEYLLSFLIGETPETNNSAFIVVLCRTIETTAKVAFRKVGAMVSR